MLQHTEISHHYSFHYEIDNTTSVFQRVVFVLYGLPGSKLGLPIWFRLCLRSVLAVWPSEDTQRGRVSLSRPEFHRSCIYLSLLPLYLPGNYSGDSFRISAGTVLLTLCTFGGHTGPWCASLGVLCQL